MPISATHFGYAFRINWGFGDGWRCGDTPGPSADPSFKLHSLECLVQALLQRITWVKNKMRFRGVGGSPLSAPISLSPIDSSPVDSSRVDRRQQGRHYRPSIITDVTTCTIGTARSTA